MGGPGHPMTGPDTVYNAFPVLPHLPVCSGLAAHLHRRSDPPHHPAAHRLFVPASVPFSCRLHTAPLPRVPVCPFPHCGSYSAHTKRTGRPAKFFKKSYPHSDLRLYPRTGPLYQPLCRPFLYCDSVWYTPIGIPLSRVRLCRSDVIPAHLCAELVCIILTLSSVRKSHSDLRVCHHSPPRASVGSSQTAGGTPQAGHRKRPAAAGPIAPAFAHNAARRCVGVPIPRPVRGRIGPADTRAPQAVRGVENSTVARKTRYADTCPTRARPTASRPAGAHRHTAAPAAPPARCSGGARIR